MAILLSRSRLRWQGNSLGLKLQRYMYSLRQTIDDIMGVEMTDLQQAALGLITLTKKRIIFTAESLALRAARIR